MVPTRSRLRLITVNVAKTAATATKTHLIHIHIVSQYRSICQGTEKLLGSLSNSDGDGYENVT